MKKTVQYLFKFIMQELLEYQKTQYVQVHMNIKIMLEAVVGHEMTREDIKSIQNDFIEAARRAYEAGYDGVELHGCHAYLISQFLNKKVNKRTDEYGKNPEKFVIEIIDGIRKVTPKEFIVGIRLGGFEPTIEDGIHYAKVLEKNGIDFLDISYGFMSEQEMHVNEEYKYSNAVYAAQRRDGCYQAGGVPSIQG